MPVPFYPFRFLTVMTNLPLAGYLAVIVTARFPKFFILALIGRVFKIHGLDYRRLFLNPNSGGYLPSVRFDKREKRPELIPNNCRWL